METEAPINKKVNEDRVDAIILELNKPPPNCKLIEYEEIIPQQIVPARTVKKFKLQCVENITPENVSAETPVTA